MNTNKQQVLIICFIFLLCTFSSSIAQKNIIHIDSLHIENGKLLANFHIEELFTKSVLESLNKGISIAVIYTINLWRKRPSWFDKSVIIGEFQFKVKYNKFDQRYIWMSQEERRTTNSLERVHILCSKQTNITIADVNQLEPENIYYITIKGILKPHLINDIEDVKDWLSGEVKDVDLKTLREPRRSQEKISGRIFTFFKNITGLGDRIFNCTSREFSVEFPIQWAY